MISVDINEDFERDNPTYSEDSPYYRHDYSDKRSLPITIPNYQYVNLNSEHFVAYNVHMAGRHLGSRRYNE